MDINKQTLFALIERMTIDSKVKKHVKDERYHYDFRIGINLISENRWGKELIYYYKDEVVSPNFSDISFKKVDFTNEGVVYKRIVVKFDNEPPIKIEPKITYELDKIHEIEARKFFFIKDSIIAKESKVKFDYTLKCGNYNFPLTVEEVNYLYNNILAEKNKQHKEIEDNEIKSRLEKYKITNEPNSNK